MLYSKAFRGNILSNLENVAFSKPICEVLMNQKFFNGIGNYLRAEILFRGSVPPFDPAREVLEALQIKQENTSLKIKSEKPDILELCHTIQKEVLSLGGGKGVGNWDWYLKKISKLGLDCKIFVKRTFSSFIKMSHQPATLAIMKKWCYNLQGFLIRLEWNIWIIEIPLSELFILKLFLLIINNDAKESQFNLICLSMDFVDYSLGLAFAKRSLTIIYV